MSELLSSQNAKLAWANGENIQYQLPTNKDWVDIDDHCNIGVFNTSAIKLRLKPRTITINGVELNQCYSVAIDYTKNEVKVEFKNRNDAEALHDVISKLYGFK